MKAARIMAVAVLIVVSSLALHVAQAQSVVLVQPPGIKRTDLLRNDLSVPGREVIQVLVEFAQGWRFPSTRIRAKHARLCHRRLTGVCARWRW